jgi:hypothetical protein
MYSPSSLARVRASLVTAFLSLTCAFATHAQTVPVRVSWSTPAANATVSGRAAITLTGQGFRNVEIFRGGALLVRATVNASGTSATATIDTSMIANGALTLTAHAWNSPPGTSFTSEADAGSRAFTVNNTVPVSLAWAAPVANSSIAGRVQFRLIGQGFRNVEIRRSGQMLTRAAIASDGKSATATIDTSQIANGSVTFTAHAWNSAPGQPFTSEADAGSLAVRINNPVATNPGLILGVYSGNDVAAIQQFESWFGRRVDGILGYTGNASWQDYDGSVGWAIGLWGAIDRPVLWSIPLIPNGATLAEAATGAYNDHYRRAAQQLAASRPQDAVIYIRTGWEFNGDWFPWTTHGGRSQAFIGAFRQFVTTFRSVSNRFVFEWNVNVGDVGANPEEAYPGDAYVDLIGMDFYWNTDWDPTDPVQAWDSMVNRKWGLAWHQQFAAAHGKRTTYSEWGIRSSGGAPYITRAKTWFTTHDVVYQTYWNSNNAFPGQLSNGQYGAAGEQYRSSFR